MNAFLLVLVGITLSATTLAALGYLWRLLPYTARQRAWVRWALVVLAISLSIGMSLGFGPRVARELGLKTTEYRYSPSMRFSNDRAWRNEGLDVWFMVGWFFAWWQLNGFVMSATTHQKRRPTKPER